MIELLFPLLIIIAFGVLFYSMYNDKKDRERIRLRHLEEEKLFKEAFDDLERRKKS